MNIGDVLVWQGSPAAELPRMALFGYSFLAVLFAAGVVLTLAGKNRVLERIACSATLRTFGKYSYALYLFHMPVFKLLPALLVRLPGGAEFLNWLRDDAGMAGSTLILGTLGTLLTLPLAWLSWQLYERHWLGLKRYFAPDQTTRLVVVRPQPCLSAPAFTGADDAPTPEPASTLASTQQNLR